MLEGHQNFHLWDFLICMTIYKDTNETDIKLMAMPKSIGIET